MDTPKRRDAERTRESILNAAEALFAERGYELTSLQAVGARAGVSRGTPGYFFGSKDGLYTAVLTRSFAQAEVELAAAYEQAAADSEPLAAISTLVSAYLSFPPTFVRLVEREALRGGDALDDLVPRREQIQETLSRLNALAATHLKPAAPAFILISLVALTWFPFAHRDTTLRTLGLSPDDPEFMSAYSEFVSETLMFGLARNGHSSRRDDMAGVTAGDASVANSKNPVD